VAKTGANKVTVEDQTAIAWSGCSAMKIFVTGGAGFMAAISFGMFLVLAATMKSSLRQVTYAGNLANLESVAEKPELSVCSGDICDAASVEAAMDAATRCHFAAESHVDRSI